LSTIQQLVDQTKADYLDTGQREVISRLSADLNNSSLTFTLTGQAPVPYSVLTIDYEDIYIISVTGSGVTDSVRGWNGTTKAAHVAATALVYHNQKFPIFKVLRQMNNEVRSLTSEGIYRVRTINLSTVSGQLGYDLTGVSTDFLRVLGVQLRYLTGSTALDYTRQIQKVVRNLPATDFPSGYGMFFNRSLPVPRTMQVVYAAQFGELTTSNLTTDANDATIGVPPEIEDILPIGTAIRLVVGREPKRSFTEAQTESRDSQDVPPGAVANSATELRRLRAQRIYEERARLQSKYPMFLNLTA
jgi:hypothetical protein